MTETLGVARGGRLGAPGPAWPPPKPLWSVLRSGGQQVALGLSRAGSELGLFPCCRWLCPLDLGYPEGCRSSRTVQRRKMPRPKLCPSPLQHFSPWCLDLSPHPAPRVSTRHSLLMPSPCLLQPRNPITTLMQETWHVSYLVPLKLSPDDSVTFPLGSQRAYPRGRVWGWGLTSSCPGRSSELEKPIQII